MVKLAINWNWKVKESVKGVLVSVHEAADKVSAQVLLEPSMENAALGACFI